MLNPPIEPIGCHKSSTDPMVALQSTDPIEHKGTKMHLTLVTNFSLSDPQGV